MSSLNRLSKVGATYVSYQPGRREAWQEHDHWPEAVISYWKKQTRARYADDLVIYMRDPDGVELRIASIYTKAGLSEEEPKWGYKIPPGYTTLYVGTCSCRGADMDCTKEDVDWILIRKEDPRYVR